MPENPDPQATDEPTQSPTHRETTRFSLVRHAQSTWNAQELWQGHADPPLSGEGRAQAVALAETFRSRDADALVSSDLERARQTAVGVGAALGLAPRPTAALRELDVGRWSGCTRAQIEAADPELLTAFETGDPDVRPGGGESRRALRDRVREFVESLAAERPGAHFVLVVHLGVIRALVPGAEPGHAEILETTLSTIRVAMEEREIEDVPPTEPGIPL